MDTFSGLFGWVPLVGGFLLAGVLLYALLANRKRSRRSDIQKSESGAERLSAKIERDDKAR